MNYTLFGMPRGVRVRMICLVKSVNGLKTDIEKEKDDA